MALFDTLWRNHPALQTPPVLAPCATAGGVSNHQDQCVIRLGVAMGRSGINLQSYTGVFCWSGHGKTHPLRVEEMVRWLDSDHAPFVGDAAIWRRGTGPQKTWQDYQSFRGICAWINFWGTGNQGDHIDLWNGSSMAHGNRDYFEHSQEIWFWRME